MLQNAFVSCFAQLLYGMVGGLTARSPHTPCTVAHNLTYGHYLPLEIHQRCSGSAMAPSILYPHQNSSTRMILYVSSTAVRVELVS